MENTQPGQKVALVSSGFKKNIEVSIFRNEEEEEDGWMEQKERGWMEAA